MKRAEVLNRLGYKVPANKQNRLVILSDIACEADDQFAIAQHLLTPSSDVKAIVAGHFEWRFHAIEKLKPYQGTSMLKSFAEGQKLLELMKIDDVPLLKGSQTMLASPEDCPPSEGADFIVREALREDERPLYIAIQGSLTDLAIAYNREPRIADCLTAIWIGGAQYPEGGDETNLRNDLLAAKVVFASPIPIWQIPINVYANMELSLAELVDRVRPNGEIGAYLCEQMLTLNEWYGRVTAGKRYDFPHGESWSIGDNPTVSVLLQNKSLKCWHIETAPQIGDDGSYTPNPGGKPIRVYDWVDVRMTLEDLYAKLRLCYGENSGVHAE